MRSFKKFVEATDIFGFDKDQSEKEQNDPFLINPIHQFDTELMIDLLSKKSVGTLQPISGFNDEIQWGTQPGAVKVECDTGYTFFIKRLNMDKQGTPRWVTKRAFQLNRNGYGGYEDSVAQEVHEHVSQVFKQNLDAPVDDFDELQELTVHLYGKMKRACRNIFIPEGIRKLSDHAYIIQFGVRGQGVEARDHTRVEANQTLISYDKDHGTIRVTNYNIKSATAGEHSWKIMPSDLDLMFFPSQNRDEVSEAIAVHMKYY